LYVVYMCQKSLNFTYAFKCYQQNVSGFTLAGPPCRTRHGLRIMTSVFKIRKIREFYEIFKIRKIRINSFYNINSNCSVFEFAQH